MSKKPEQLMWEYVRPFLVRGKLDPHRVENSCESGTPDVNIVSGWLELKCLDQWPKRSSTVVKLEHYTKEQRSWGLRRSKYGGNVFLLLKVGLSHYVLLRSQHAALWIGKMNKEQLLKSAIAHWEDGLPSDFADWLHF